MNISSLVVKTEPKNLDQVIDDLKKSNLCEVHYQHENGNIVVVIEGETSEDESKIIKQIQNMLHVISVTVAYSYCEEEIDKKHFEILNGKNSIPEVLEKDIPVEEISYSGKLKF